MRAGTCETAGPEGSFGCQWGRASTAGGEFSAMLTDADADADADADPDPDGSGRAAVDKGEVLTSTRWQERKQVGRAAPGR
ncbi:hypothetical protein ACFVS9_25590 [Streptomyces sp. NPDC058008]|uniref:hypothetical protein n=1 Tax=Streptomyces sp. NPDC058008 TaxID=3346303 RepID=UPI0036EF8A6D